MQSPWGPARTRNIQSHQLNPICCWDPKNPESVFFPLDLTYSNNENNRKFHKVINLVWWGYSHINNPSYHISWIIHHIYHYIYPYLLSQLSYIYICIIHHIISYINIYQILSQLSHYYNSYSHIMMWYPQGISHGENQAVCSTRLKKTPVDSELLARWDEWAKKKMNTSSGIPRVQQMKEESYLIHINIYI